MLSICFFFPLRQVSVVGVIRGFLPFVTNIQFSVDDMTGPPLNVKQWVNTEASGINLSRITNGNCNFVVKQSISNFSQDSALMTCASPGTYVKLTGNLRNFSVSNANKGFKDNYDHWLLNGNEKLKFLICYYI